MYNIIVFETAKEVLDALTEKEIPENKLLPEDTHLVFEGVSYVSFGGEGTGRFNISEDVTQEKIIHEMAERLGIRIYET